MEASWTTEKLVSIITIQCHNPENHDTSIGKLRKRWKDFAFETNLLVEITASTS
jgi:hypothetical protein